MQTKQTRWRLEQCSIGNNALRSSKKKTIAEEMSLDEKKGLGDVVSQTRCIDTRQAFRPTQNLKSGTQT